MKAKVVKAYYHDGRAWKKLRGGQILPFGARQCHIVICPHNYTITARPPASKASKKKGAKR